MQLPPCACVETVAGHQQRWDLAGSYTCPDCGRLWVACTHCGRAVQVAAGGACLVCGELTVSS